MPTGKKANAEIFIKERAKGTPQREAYEKANPDSIATKKTKDELASRMESKYKARLEELQRKADAGAVMNIQKTIAALSEIANNENEKTENRISAMDKILKANGGYTERQEIKVNAAVTLDDKREAARAWLESIRDGKTQTSID